MSLAAVVWTHWLVVGLTVGVVLATVAVVVGYFRSVVRPKYPPRGSRQA
ncbi:MAG TPA: hypothetical protein VEW93_13615 [Acidimicrobiales bacterium]|nr:hypothetical protein [Acidimicrobiales bacterium]